MKTKPLIKNIPLELRKLNQWVGYRYPKKTPLTAEGGPAKVNDKATFTSFDRIVNSLNKKIFTGIGFVFTKNIPFTGIDLDNCRNPETKSIENQAMKWINHFSSYTEISPSGKGIHIIVKGKLPPSSGHKRGNYEVYDNGRYFTVTGNIINAHKKIVDKNLDAFCEEIFGKHKNNSEKIEIDPLRIEDILNKIKNAGNREKFNTLFNEGDWKSLGYPSQSEADQALCSMLVYWAEDEDLIDTIFRKSKLFRPKWNERRGEKTYGEQTIKKAFEFQEQNKKENNYEKEIEPFPIIQISKVEEKPVEYLVDKILPKNAVGYITGQPGTFKTWLAWHLGVSVASETKAFNKYKTKQGKVLAFNAEDPPAEVTRKRIKALSAKNNLKFSDLDMHLIDINSLQISEEKEFQKLLATIKKYSPTLLILDPFRNIHTLDENSASEITSVLNNLRKIQKESSCTVLLVCHDRKSSNNGQRRLSQTRGSNAIEGWRDFILCVDLDKEKDIIKVNTYQRFDKPQKPFSFQFNYKESSENELETASLEIIDPNQIKAQKHFKLEEEMIQIVKNNSPQTRNQIREKLEISNQSSNRIVKNLIDQDIFWEEKKGRKNLIYIKNTITPCK